MVEALLVVFLAAVLTSEAKVDAAPQQTLAQVARDTLRDLRGLGVLLSDHFALPETASGHEGAHVILDLLLELI